MAHATQSTPEAPHWILMAKALKGELSDQEQKDFAAWLEADEAHAEQWASALTLWKEVGQVQDTTFTPHVEQAWQKAKVRMNLPEAPAAATPEQEASITPMFSWSAYLRYAAVVVLAIGLGWLGYTQWNTSPQWAEVATLAGERKVFYLPDSSQVTLNENSTLRYQTAFNGPEREVEITGEGFFQVRKNPEQAFVVHTQGADTKVLGTSFNVRARSQEKKEVSVAVFTGKVAFSSTKANQQIILTPGFTGTLQADGSVSKKETGEDKPSWNSLSFQGTTIQEIISTLQNHFGVTVQIASPALKECTFTGTFDNPDVQNILQVLSASLNLDLTRTGTAYHLSGKGCTH